LKKPWKYFELDMKNRKRVYGRSVIGMYNFENEALRKGVAAKEVEVCFLGLYANNLSILEGLQLFSDKYLKVKGKMKHEKTYSPTSE
jgi:hypothetical protein